jgi:putative flippase GtrA
MSTTMPDARRVTRVRGLLKSRFVLYALVGLAGTAGHYAFLLTAVTLGVMTPVPASVAGALVGATINFVLNALVTFGGKGAGRSHLAWGTALRFFATAGLAAAANGGLMALLVDGLRLDYRLAQLLVTAALMCVTYFVNSVWTFRASQAH